MRPADALGSLLEAQDVNGPDIGALPPVIDTRHSSVR